MSYKQFSAGWLLLARCRTPLSSFANDAVAGPVFTVPVVEQGRAALEAIDQVLPHSASQPWATVLLQSQRSSACLSQNSMAPNSKCVLGRPPYPTNWIVPYQLDCRITSDLSVELVAKAYYEKSNDCQKCQ